VAEEPKLYKKFIESPYRMAIRFFTQTRPFLTQTRPSFVIVGLPKNVAEEPKLYKKFIESPEPHTAFATLPELCSAMNDFQKLLVLRTLRLDKLVHIDIDIDIDIYVYAAGALFSDERLLKASRPAHAETRQAGAYRHRNRYRYRYICIRCRSSVQR